MKTKISKLIKLTAACLFLIALAINVKVTLEDPFAMLSEDVIAQATTVVETSASGTTAGAWVRTDGDCKHTFYGKVGAKITIFGGTIITIGSDGTFVYTYGDGKTDCATGGNQQCKARYCPPLQL